MSTISDLVESRIRESEIQLRHIDTLLSQARAVAPEKIADPLLAEIEANRTRLARDLDALRHEPRHDLEAAAQRGAQLKTALQAVGLQFEQLLGSVLQRSPR